MIAIGIVVPRYGNEVVGGAETLARNVAERLLRQGARVTVFTTCARDPRTWRNEHPSGESLLKGVRIKRFPIARERAADSHDEKKRLCGPEPFSPT